MMGGGNLDFPRAARARPKVFGSVRPSQTDRTAQAAPLRARAGRREKGPVDRAHHARSRVGPACRRLGSP